MPIQSTDRDGLIHGMSDAVYHGGPELSSSAMKTLLDSPARYQHERANRVEKSAYDLGHAVHAKILGAGLDVAVLDFPDYRTKAARDERDGARAGPCRRPSLPTPTPGQS
jgi:hypothetical protein